MTAQNSFTASLLTRQENLRTETILESYISSRLQKLKFAANSGIPTALNLPHSDPRSNRHGESIMIVPPNA
jgi:hypothetical protein